MAKNNQGTEKKGILFPKDVYKSLELKLVIRQKQSFTPLFPGANPIVFLHLGTNLQNCPKA